MCKKHWSTETFSARHCSYGCISPPVSALSITWSGSFLTYFYRFCTRKCIPFVNLFRSVQWFLVLQKHPISMLRSFDMLLFIYVSQYTNTHIAIPHPTSPPTYWSVDLLKFVAGAAHLADWWALKAPGRQRLIYLLVFQLCRPGVLSQPS